MNKNRYRIIFNKARGLLMAVAEIASAGGKHTGQSGPESSGLTPTTPPWVLAQLKSMAFGLLLALGVQVLLVPLAHAQIVAYKAAPASQQPTILNAGNGVPLINIQTPSAAGVSRNTYSQFDMLQQGAIFNNSRTNTQTQLGGWVQGNPWLAAGTARVILNEVVSANPSQLLGYLEVAGNSAHVVIANPAGVTCSGCGFINANRVTLTTGTPVINGGNLDGYRVEGGTIRIQGGGMDASGVTHTDLIARAVEVNAGVWANALKVSTGANQVNTEHTQTTPVASTGTAPAFALDVSQLGGMYAGKITLVGTEAGVGVRNAGQIGASAGDVVVTVDGRLQNSGTVYAKGNATIVTPGAFDNTGGTLVANGNVSLHAASLDNSHGVLGAVTGTLTADANAGAINNHGGQIQAAQDLTLTSNGLNNSDGLIAGQNLYVDTRSQALDNRQGALSGSGTVNLQSSALNNDAGLIQAAGALIVNTHGQTLINTNSGSTAGIVGQSTVSLATGDLNNNAGFISANDALTLDSTAITNTAGAKLIGAQNIQITGSSFDNRGGQLQALGNTTVAISGIVDNTASLIRAGQGMSLAAAQLINRNTQGTDQGIEGKTLAISANQIDNTTGALRADQALTLTSGGTVNNSGGLISSARALDILDPIAVAGTNAGNKTLAVINTGGTLIADQQLTVDSKRLTGDGAVLSQGNVTVKLLDDYTHAGALAKFAANGNASLETTGVLNNEATLQAGRTLTLKAGTINNAATGTIVASTVNLTATASHTLSNRGLIDGSDTFIDSGTVNNLGTGRIYGDHVAIAATTLTNAAETVDGVTSAPVIAARNQLDIGATTINNREHGLLFSAGDMSIGGALDASHQATGQAGTFNNASATIEALGNLALNVGQINNTNEHFSTTVATVDAQAITEYQGSGSANRYLAGTSGVYVHNDESDQLMTPEGNYEDWNGYYYTRTTTETQIVTSDPGKILAGGSMRITANTLLNRNSQIIAGGTLTGAIGSLTNDETPGERTFTDSGMATHYWRDHEKGRDSTGSSSAAYTPPPTIQAISLGAAAYQQNTTPTGTGTTVSALTLGRLTQVAASASATNSVIRTITPTTTLPSNSLFRRNPIPANHYLIETDPRFANYRTWLSSDYMLKALSLSTTQKRLGDGFYEQRLINEQVAQLTGRRFLDGYANNEEQYQSLMNAGVTYAKAWTLIPGVALTTGQMAALTTDIVWLVEKDIDLGNGQTAKALVPQVYVRAQPTDLAPSTGLLAGNAIYLKLTGDFTNSGTIAGRQLVSLTAENISNLGGRISGQNVLIAARTDLSNLGGTIQAENQLIASAGHNLTVESTTRTQTNAQGSRTTIDRVAGLYVTGSNGTLIASAGNDMTLLAAAIVNANPTAAGVSSTANATTTGGTLLSAGHDLTLGTVSEAASNTIVWDGKNKRSDAHQTDVGTTIQTTGDLTLQAGRNLTAKAASVTSDQGALSVLASNDLTLTVGQTSDQVDEAHQHTEKGLLSSKTRSTRDTLDQTLALASTFSGNTVALQAGQDILIKGSTVSAIGDLTANAGRDFTVETAQDTRDETHFKSVKKTGFSMSMGAISYGKSSLQQEADGQSVTQLASNLSGTNIRTASGRDTTLIAANVLADQDITVLAGRNVDILAAASTNATQNQTKSESTSFGLTPSFSGRFTAFSKISASEDGTATATRQSTTLLAANRGDLTVRAGLDTQHKGTGQGNVLTQGADLLAGNAITLSSNAIDLQAVADESTSHTLAKSKSVTLGSALAGPLGDKITAIGDAIERARNTDNDRLKGALALKAGYDAYKLTQGQDVGKAAAAGSENVPGAGSAASGIGVSVTLGTSKSESESRTRDTQVTGTNLQAKTIDLTATETDLSMAAAKLQAQTIYLTAERNIRLQAAANTSEIESRNKSSSAGLGVTFAFGGAQNGLSFQVNASRAKGQANGNETVWDNTFVTASDTLTLKSGRDTTLQGAQLAGNTVTLDVGGDLLIQTLQDSSAYVSKQSSSGFSLSLCIPPICGGALVTGSLSASRQSIKHNYLSAVGQSGIAAGEGGFDINVGQRTGLIGAAITGSSDLTKNHLTTASLESRDLANTQDMQSSSSSFGFAYGGASALSTLASNAASNLLANLNGNAALPKNGSEQGTTQSVISPATITLTGTGDPKDDEQSQQTADELTKRDPKTANGSLKNSLTLQQAQELQNEIRKQQENMEAAKLIGAVLSNVVGDVAAKQFKELQDKENARAFAAGEKPIKVTAWSEGSIEKVALHGLVGLIEAKIGNGNVAAGVLGAISQEAMAPILSEYLTKNGFDYNEPGLSKEEATKRKTEYDSLMQLGTTLVGTAVGTLASGDVKGAATGAQAAFVGVTNNYLKHDEAVRMVALQNKKALGQCGPACQQEIDALKQKDEQRNAVLDACQGVSNAGCNTARQEVRNAAAEYIRKEKIALNQNSGYSIINTYATENRETRQYADGTLDRRALGVVEGAAGTVVDAAKAVGSLAGNLLRSAFGDESSQQALKAGASAAWGYVKNPDNWPYLLGVMTPDQREQLAQAYEKGDGNTVGRLMGEQAANILSNIPSGGAAGTIKIVKAADRIEDLASVLAKAEKAIETSVVKATSFGRIPERITTSSGYVIQPVADKTTTILGRWTADMDNVINTQLTYPKTADFGAKVGGFNVLNVDTTLGGTEFWNIYNKPFLDQAMARNDVITLATVPRTAADIMAFDGIPSGMFGRELEHLVKSDYRPVNINKKQWQEIKEWYK